MGNSLKTSVLNDLSFTPATLFGWGFKTEENITKSSAIYQNVSNSIIEKLTKIDEKDSCSFIEDREKNEATSIESAITVANVVNVLGYIPLIGRLIGAVRILAVFNTPLEQKQKIAHTIRGISELTGYNKIRFIIDIAATVFHFAKKNKFAVDNYNTAVGFAKTAIKFANEKISSNLNKKTFSTIEGEISIESKTDK